MKNKIFVLSVLLGLCVMTANAQNTMKIGTNFAHLVAGESQFKPFRTGVNFATDTNVWNPVFLNEIKIYKCFRFSTLGGIKNSAIDEWKDRRKRTDPGQNVQTWNDAGTDMPNQVSLELLIDLCNRTGADLWHPVFHRLVDRNGVKGDFIRKMAILIKTGVDMDTVNIDGITDLSNRTAQYFIDFGGKKTCEPLADTLKWYVEYSNETWNGIFLSNSWSKTEGTALSLDANADNAGSKFHAWACIRIYDEVEKVFGKNSNRIVKVCSGWTINYTLTITHINVFKNTSLNPTGQKPDCYAIAPYISINNSDGLPVEERLDIATLVGHIKTHYTQAKNYGIGLIAYEGGSGSCWYYPELYDIMMDYLKDISPYLSLFNHFIHTSSGCYGAMNYTSQPLAEAYKYHALYDWQRNYLPSVVKFVLTRNGKPLANTQVSFYNEIINTDATGTAIFRRFYVDSDPSYTILPDSMDPVTGTITYTGNDITKNIIIGTVPSSIQNDLLSVSLFPNPASDYLYVNNAAGAELELWDMQGEALLHQSVYRSAQAIDISLLTQGCYIATITKGTDRIVKKIIIK